MLQGKIDEDNDLYKKYIHEYHKMWKKIQHTYLEDPLTIHEKFPAFHSEGVIRKNEKKEKKENKKLLENIENGILSGYMIDMSEITRLLAEHEIKDVAKCILKYPKSRMRKTKAKKYILCNTCKQTLRNKKYLEIHRSENPRCLLDWERKKMRKKNAPIMTVLKPSKIMQN